MNAYGSLMELLNQLILSYDFGFVKEAQYVNLRDSVEELSKRISAYKKFFLNFFNRRFLCHKRQHSLPGLPVRTVLI